MGEWYHISPVICTMTCELFTVTTTGSTLTVNLIIHGTLARVSVCRCAVQLNMEWVVWCVMSHVMNHYTHYYMEC